MEICPMKKSILMILSVFMTWNFSEAQHLIGVKKEMVPDLVKKEMKGFRLDNTSRNNNYNYQKFLNTAGTKTLIVFYDEKNLSASTRMVCDYSEFDFMLDDMNTKFRKKGQDIWEYTANKQKFEVTLRKDEWYCVFSTKKR